MAKALNVDPTFRRDLYEASLQAANGSMGNVCEYLDNQNKVMNQWNEAVTYIGNKVQVNKIVRFHVNDGYALYVVGKVGPRSCTLVHLPFGDAYHSPVVGPNGSCPTTIVEQMIRYDEMWSSHATKLTNENDQFFNSLTVGQIVHYNSIDGWVRCKVVMGSYRTSGGGYIIGKCLLPIALVGTIRHQVNGEWVGDWYERNIYNVTYTGEIEHGLQTQKILNQETFRPSAADIFEFKRELRPNQSDPTMAPEISLNPPPFTPKQLATQAQWRDVEALKKLLQQIDKSPLDILREVKNYSHEAVTKHALSLQRCPYTNLDFKDGI
jgi:hypothetical protein